MATEGTSEGEGGDTRSWEGLLWAWGWGRLLVMGPAGLWVQPCPKPICLAWNPACHLGPRDSSLGSLSFLIWKTRLGYSGCQSTGELSQTPQAPDRCPTGGVGLGLRHGGWQDLLQTQQQWASQAQGRR